MRDIKLEDSWLRELRGEFDKEYMFNLREFLIGEMKMGKNILPEPKIYGLMHWYYSQHWD